MIKRILEYICFDEKLGRQMRFIAGPRQTGKTTLAKLFLHKQGSQNLYYNWDVREVRMRHKQNSLFYMKDVYKMAQKKAHIPWICFDEIHKMPKWKNILKASFDSAEEKINFIVTGSARLEMFNKAGDSLAGRYFLFKLFPLTLFELTHNNNFGSIFPPGYAKDFIEAQLNRTIYHQDTMENLLNYSGFPEPFLKSRKAFNYKWHNIYIDRLIREDLRDLTHIRELENIATLITFLPERIGSPLSFNSLKEDIEVSHSAIRTYLKALELSCILFFIHPYNKKISRAIKKEKKCYLYDWSIIKDEALRFENYIAVELKVLTELWNDIGENKFELYYVRTREGKETDFLIVKDREPWLLLEAKLSDVKIDNHHYTHAEALGNIPIIQLIAKKDVATKERSSSYRISASRFFG
ncbi:MAG: AAA family ATPase [bacterium]